jgi:cobyrinic acid a,c-diamide synthase
VDADPGLRYAYTVQRGHGIDGRRDGVIVNNLLASYAHLRATGGNDWPARFVAFVRQCATPSERTMPVSNPRQRGLAPCSA